MGADERHYRPEDLNRLFAIAAVILLSAVLFLVFSDYARHWKDYQEQYQDLDVEATRVKYDDEYNRLKEDASYKELKEKIAQAQKDYQSKCTGDTAKHESADIDRLTSQSEVLKQQYRVVKAQYDAAKFRFEEAREHNSQSVKIEQIRYQSLEQKVKQLNLEIQKVDTKISISKKIFDECGQALKDLEKQSRALVQKQGILERKLKKIDPNEMSLTNRIANIIRNFPIMDLSNPTYKVKQIVLKDIRDDINFMSVPKVDRCTTCHLGIANPDFANAPQPLRTHPNLELYLSKESPHPLDDFGCTVCHNGRGRGTDFISAAHTPRDEEQAQQWRRKYGWQESHHWDKPMYPKPYVEAGCFKCHSGQTTISGADKLNLGLNLIERAGCYACHNIDKYKDWPKPGPDLTHLASKATKDWTYRWLKNPQSFRHNTWMPSFFGQSNTNDPESIQRSQQEIHAIVEYLFKESSPYELSPNGISADSKRGEELFDSIGCLGCHKIDGKITHASRTQNMLKQEQGPNLIGLGSKTSRSWIASWLKDPQKYHPSTRMPNLRLSDQEAEDIAQYLAQEADKSFQNASIPGIDDKVLAAIVFDFLRKTVSDDEALAQANHMSRDEKLHFAGQKLIAQYGCFSCHEIKGFQGFKPIGTDLTEEGSKPEDKLDFGFADIEHTKQAWFFQKLKDPRIFDHNKIRTADEKLRMPNYHFTDEEAQAITTALLGFVREQPGKIKPRTYNNLAMEKGDRIIREYNCQGCHLINGQGGVIRDNITQWLVKYNNKDLNEAQAVTTTFSPPNLSGEGKKVQTQWLFEFIHHPITIRPWLKVRMPTYAFNATEINDILKYFNAIDKEEFPFTEYVNTELNDKELAAAQKLFSTDYFDCAKCHIVGNHMPGGSQDSWAPNFALANKRLKPEWLMEWIKNPAAIQPGTKMPTFFDPKSFNESGPPDILNGDENEQIRVLRNYIMSISSYTSSDDTSGQNQPVPQSGHDTAGQNTSKEK